MDSERRRHARYGNEELVLNVARPGIRGMLRINPTAECLNFSRAGLQFASDQDFTLGDRLILDLHVNGIQLNEIFGEVVSQTPLSDGQRCIGIRFCFHERTMQRQVIMHDLLMIEDRLRRDSEYPEVY